ncbi:hypothetical protein ACSTS3_15570 [Aquimarina muelleri]|uniref:hypothetical protein n=1 Tax=Aquimarina muelleri TaxID=279356 RepID=UPI003F686EEF
MIKLLRVGSAILFASTIVGCSSNDDDPVSIAEKIKIEEAKISAFPLFGIPFTKVDIIDPEIVDNKEVKYGEINITVPSTTVLDNISALITSEELNLSKFSISPGNDVKLSYVEGKTNVYTIRNIIGGKEELLHYNVSITKEPIEVSETLKITSFTFEKSKNPSLPNDIEISRIVEGIGVDRIYLFVPAGTDFTNLIPTITYDGTKIYYYQDSSQRPGSTNNEYPAQGKSIDFKYPKSFILEVKDRNNEEFKTTSVIVDVVNPLIVETTSVTIPDTKEGSTEVYMITKWINQGNHMLVYGKADAQENQDPDLGTNAIRVTRSLPSVGLVPGESADVKAGIASASFPRGTYKTTAVFYPRFRYNEEVDDLLEPARLNITAKIIE